MRAEPSPFADLREREDRYRHEHGLAPEAIVFADQIYSREEMIAAGRNSLEPLLRHAAPRLARDHCEDRRDATSRAPAPRQPLFISPLAQLDGSEARDAQRDIYERRFEAANRRPCGCWIGYNVCETCVPEKDRAAYRL